MHLPFFSCWKCVEVLVCIPYFGKRRKIVDVVENNDDDDGGGDGDDDVDDIE